MGAGGAPAWGEPLNTGRDLGGGGGWCEVPEGHRAEAARGSDEAHGRVCGDGQGRGESQAGSTTHSTRHEGGGSLPLSRSEGTGRPLGLPASRELQVQATRRFHFPPHQMGKKSKSQVIPRAGEAAQQGPAGTEPKPGYRCSSQCSTQRRGAGCGGGEGFRWEEGRAGVTGGFISVYKICFLSPADCTWAPVIFCLVFFFFFLSA